ncbi:MAG TPA: hypothetical protein VJ750_11320 [Rhizomicrobium sp.]|nr:hypothetical protein [Rhizomicrobium sp.]
MTVPGVRAALTAMFLGTAALGAVAVALAAPAQAAVSFKVGTALKEAQSLAAAGNFKAAMAKVNEAEAQPGRTAEDNDIIGKMKNYIAVASGDASIGGAAGAKAKFLKDYNARNYKEVIASADVLRKYNAFDATAMQIIAQSYYLSGDKAGCVRYIKNNFSNPGDTILEVLIRCAYDVGDDATQRTALESLVSRGGKPEHWKSLLRLSERSQGMTDHNSLDINRIKLLTGNIVTKDDYILLAQLALQLGNAAEAQSVMEKGVAAKVLTDDRSARLLALTKTQAAANAANEAKTLAAANAQPQGDALVKLGEDQIGRGNAKGAIATIQAGLKKPLKDPANGQIRLGHAYFAAGQKADAQAAFNKVKEPAREAMVAHLWYLVARR